MAASFGEMRLIELAEEAGDGAPGDPAVVRKLEKAVAELEQHRLP